MFRCNFHKNDLCKGSCSKEKRIDVFLPPKEVNWYHYCIIQMLVQQLDNKTGHMPPESVNVSKIISTQKNYSPLILPQPGCSLAWKKKSVSKHCWNFTVAEQIRLLACALFSAMIRIGLALIREQFWESGRLIGRTVPRRCLIEGRRQHSAVASIQSSRPLRRCPDPSWGC